MPMAKFLKLKQIFHYADVVTPFCDGSHRDAGFVAE
jgi:hypothetical protein